MKLRIERVYDSHERHYVWKLTGAPYYVGGPGVIICESFTEAIDTAHLLAGMEATA